MYICVIRAFYLALFCLLFCIISVISVQKCLFYTMLFYNCLDACLFLMRDRKGSDANRRGGREELGGIQEGK